MQMWSRAMKWFSYLYGCKLFFILLSVTSGSFPGIHVGMSDQTQTQITDILDMVMQSGQDMRYELMYDVGG